MEHIWRTGEELGPVSVVPQTREPWFSGVSFAVGMSWKDPLFPLGVLWSSLGPARSKGRSVRVSRSEVRKLVLRAPGGAR